MTALSQPPQSLIEKPAPITRRRAALTATLGVVGGLLLAVVWSFELVDGVIGDNVANGVLGYDAKHTVIAGSLAGLIFAFVSGFAGTFTACNIAVFGALPEVAEKAHGGRLRALLAPLGWLAVGMLVVAVSYGAVAVLIGENLPQLSTATVGGLPVRLLQASVVYGVIGLAFVYLGLAALHLVPDPFRHRPRARMLTLGALVGGLLVGRPFPLFRKLMAYAVETDNPLFGAFAFALQSLGNILVMTVLALLLVYGTRGAFVRWLSRPDRAAFVTGLALVLLGSFMVIYWDVRLPAMFGYGWFPVMPWNT